MPPRVGKTENAIIIGSLYIIMFKGPASVGYVTFSEGLSFEKSDRLKAAYTRILKSPLARVFDLPQFSKTINSKQHWQLDSGFEFKALGLGSTVTGREFDYLWVDDPYKNFMDALSDKGREKVENYWSSSLYNRLAPGGRIGLIHTRWHENDLTTYVQKEEVYDQIIIPAQAMDDDPLGREPGEYLESRFTPEHWQRQKTAAGLYFWQAQFQQAPETKSGDWFTDLKIDDWPETIAPIAYLDTAFDGADTVALSIIGQKAADYHTHGKVWNENVYDVIDFIIAALVKYKAGKIYIEKNADNGGFARQFRERLKIRKLPIIVIDDTVSEDKHARIVSYAYYHKDNIIFDPESDEDFMRQVINYNKGVKPCDAPDSLAGGMRFLVRPAGSSEGTNAF